MTQDKVDHSAQNVSGPPATQGGPARQAGGGGLAVQLRGATFAEGEALLQPNGAGAAVQLSAAPEASGGASVAAKAKGLSSKLITASTELWKKGEKYRPLAEQLMQLNNIAQSVAGSAQQLADIASALDDADYWAEQLKADVSDVDAAAQWGQKLAEALAGGLEMSSWPGAGLYAKVVRGTVGAFIALQSHVIEKTDKRSYTKKDEKDSPFKSIPK